MDEKSIITEALAIESREQRTAFLQEICADNSALLQRIEDLLRWEAPDDPLLDNPLFRPHYLDTNDFEQIRLDFLEPSSFEGSRGKLGPYEILGVLGVGGAAIVLNGFDEGLNRNVAIKVPNQQIAHSASARKRFHREAQAAAAVIHPNVITIHSVGYSNDLPYLAMENVNGETLQQKLEREGRLDVDKVLQIGAQIAQGLAAAHDSGLIHRDIKPANILLESKEGRVKITDFGLARAADDVTVTLTDHICGTPQFMSPEQAAGEPFDHRTDLFSLGCVLYAMCTGVSPFKADSTIATIRRLCDETPSPITELNHSIPEGLGNLISRLLAKKPEQRYQTATEVAELLAPGAIHEVPATDAENNQSANATSKKPSHALRFVSIGVLALLTSVAVAVSEQAGWTNIFGSDKQDTTVLSPPGDVNADDEPEPHAQFFERLTSSQYEWSEPELLANPINSAFEESYPRLSSDGLLLVFSSNRPCPSWDNANGDIWIASRTSVEEPFTNPVNLGPMINTPLHEGQASISGDGLMLVFSRQREDGLGYDLWNATRESRDSPWSLAEKMGPGFDGDYEYNSCANLSSDGLTLDFNSFAKGGTPCVPWRSTRKSVAANWPAAEKIGLTSAPLTRNFNTFNFAAGNGLAVMLSIPDEGRTLYARERPDSPWVRLELTDDDLVPEEASVGNAFERFISMDGSTVLYDASWDTGLGQRDIWMIRRIKRRSD